MIKDSTLFITRGTAFFGNAKSIDFSLEKPLELGVPNVKEKI